MTSVISSLSSESSWNRKQTTSCEEYLDEREMVLYLLVKLEWPWYRPILLYDTRSESSDATFSPPPGPSDSLTRKRSVSARQTIHPWRTIQECSDVNGQAKPATLDQFFLWQSRKVRPMGWSWFDFTNFHRIKKFL
jgi:hypothetical protein